MKWAGWARVNGVHPQAAYRWFREDRIPVPRRLGPGTIWVEATPAGTWGRTVVYARVSSHDQRLGLDRQVARLTEWAASNGHEAGEVAAEVGSGLNGKRPKLRRILAGPAATVVVVEHRDRLARFGVGHREAVLGAHGRRIVVADPGETTSDLVRDMIEVLTCMCARRYGRPGARNRALRAVTATRQQSGEAD